MPVEWIKVDEHVLIEVDGDERGAYSYRFPDGWMLSNARSFPGRAGPFDGPGLRSEAFHDGSAHLAGFRNRARRGNVPTPKRVGCSPHPRGADQIHIRSHRQPSGFAR